LKRSSFTAVPGRLAELARPRRVDLHVHTTASDGEYTAAQVGAMARQAGLAAVAITDHDVFGSADEARASAGDQVEVISGVEISASFDTREVHLLGYFSRADPTQLDRVLARVRDARRDRFHDFVEKLAANGTHLPPDRVRIVAESSPSLGRRHLAKLLVECGFARVRVEAFHRLLGPLRHAVAPKALLPVEEAIHLVRAAGGVASLAHPPADLSGEDYARLAAMGLVALEVVYPWGRSSRSASLREVAASLGLAVSGGSDCHGPDPSHRRIGSHGITVDELNALRGWRGEPVPSACRS
jgi:predicted metal-dependent phosphoesterase TrpH